MLQHVLLVRYSVVQGLRGEGFVAFCVSGCGSAAKCDRTEEIVLREKGTVKWFNAAKGYGFIQRSTGEDVFVHHSSIQMNGYRTLENDMEVEFEVKQGPKGLQAEAVTAGT